MTPRTPHARPHAGMGAPTARTARTAHPPVKGVRGGPRGRSTAHDRAVAADPDAQPRRAGGDPMTRESADSKGRRYVMEGRVVITDAGPGYVDASVRGDGALHCVTYRRGGWSCTCPSRGRCSHLTAVGLCTAPSRAAL